MGRWLRPLVVSLAVGIGGLAAACDEMQIDTFGSIVLSGAAELDKDPDPEVAAAGSANTATDQGKLTSQLVESAIDDKGKIDVAKVDQAIDISPYDAGLRLQKAVMLTATGQDPSKSIGEARYLAQLYPFAESPHETDGRIVYRFLDLLEDAMDRVGKNSIEYSRLHTELCAEKRLYLEQFGHSYSGLDDCKT
jgi:hypothetical protein